MFAVLFVLYVVAEANKPKPVDWRVTLSKSDKNPYGSFILYSQWPIFSLRLEFNPTVCRFMTSLIIMLAIICLHNCFNCFQPHNQRLGGDEEYVAEGNYVFASASDFSKIVLDSLGFKVYSRISLVDQDQLALTL
jgi:hypothetical protein